MEEVDLLVLALDPGGKVRVASLNLVWQDEDQRWRVDVAEDRVWDLPPADLVAYTRMAAQPKVVLNLTGVGDLV